MASPRPRLVWDNMHQVAMAVGADKYQWVDPDDPRLGAPRKLEPLGRVGQSPSAAKPDGTVIAGDALFALTALNDANPLAVGGEAESDGIRLLYIDPPFNTGHTSSNYSDAVDTSLWLTALRDRLEAVKPLLAPSASVWVHLDDSETHRARCLLDEVFGEAAFVATVVWQKRLSRESRTAISSQHEYLHVYAPSGPKQWKQTRNLLPREIDDYRNRDDDPRGPWIDAPFDAPGYRPAQQYPIVNPAGETLHPPEGRSWYATEPVYKRYLEDGRIFFTRNGAGKPRLKQFPEDLPGLVPFSLWGPDIAGTNDDAKRHLMKLFPGRPVFSSPKPERLLRQVIHIATDPGDIVLDFYAGSGTTAAVAQKMGRRWIAVERSHRTVEDYLVPRLAAVVRGQDPDGVSCSEGWEGGGAFETFLVQGEDGRTGASKARRLADGLSAVLSAGETSDEHIA